MTKLELIQSIIKHRQAGAAMCTCNCVCGYYEPVDSRQHCRKAAEAPGPASHDEVRQG